MQYHPETSQQLAWGSPSAYSGMNAADDSSPLGVRNYGIKTQVEVREDKNGLTSKLLVNTLDRPGLLTGEKAREGGVVRLGMGTRWPSEPEARRGASALSDAARSWPTSTLSTPLSAPFPQTSSTS